MCLRYPPSAQFICKHLFQIMPENCNNACLGSMLVFKVSANGIRFNQHVILVHLRHYTRIPLEQHKHYTTKIHGAQVQGLSVMCGVSLANGRGTASFVSVLMTALLLVLTRRPSRRSVIAGQWEKRWKRKNNKFVM